MTRWFWKQTGGMFVEEVCAVPRAPGCGPRSIDGIIIKEGGIPNCPEFGRMGNWGIGGQAAFNLDRCSTRRRTRWLNLGV